MWDCRRCGRRWTGRVECHCPQCCNHFGSPSAFDRHMQGDRCLTGGELVAPTRNGRPRLVPVQRIHGTVWVLSSRT